MALLTLSPMPETLKLTRAASAGIAGGRAESPPAARPFRASAPVQGQGVQPAQRSARLLALEKFPKSFRPLAPSH
ncbi:MAG: hypothetical protein V8T86_12915 [Victivallis sp.]